MWDDELKAFRRSGRPDKDLHPCLQPASHLTAADWSLLERMCELLGVFNHVLIVLEGDGQLRERVDRTVKAYGLIWNVIFAYEYMLEALEKAKNDVLDEANASRWKTAVNQAWSVLNKYYDFLDECPVYYTSMVLHPRWRWRYFENKWAE